jgi:transcriptional regulator with PAS, ATPase and Fis domain
MRASEAIMEHLLLCRWPGNVRQLHNEVRRMVWVLQRSPTRHGTRCAVT